MIAHHGASRGWRAFKFTYLALVLAFLYLPIIIMIALSFNQSVSRAEWTGFTLDWYKKLFTSSSIMAALKVTLEVAAIATVISTVLGTTAAIGMHSMKKGWANVLVNLSDVWDDVSHLQQKDPQRTGYDTQKPLKLLERIVLCATKPGDMVCDLTCGSGTTLEAAALNGRSFVGVDMCPLAVQTSRRRLMGNRVNINAEDSQGEPDIKLDVITGVGNYECDLRAFTIEPGVGERAFNGLDSVTGWSGGYINDDTFYAYVHDMRSKQHPKLDAHLSIPVWDGRPAVRIEDVYGRTFYYTLDI